MDYFGIADMDVNSVLNSVNELGVLLAPIIAIATFFVARFYIVLHRRLVNRVKGKTRFMLGDVVLEGLERPFYFLVILVGIYFAAAIAINVRFERMNESVFGVLGVLWGLYTSRTIADKVVRWHLAKTGLTRSKRTIFMSLKNIVNVVLYVLALLLILAVLGIEIEPLILGAGVGGLAVALALQPTIANYFSGIYIAADKSIKVGDYIELENNMRGYVDSIGWRSTRIRTLYNNLVIIPNSKLTEMIVTNYYDPVEEMYIKIEFGVSYDSDLDNVEKVIAEVGKEVLENTAGGVKEFEPYIRYSGFDESNIGLKTILRVKTYVDQFRVKHEFIKAIMKRFRKEGIEISLPSRNVYMRDGEGIRR